MVGAQIAGRVTAGRDAPCRKDLRGRDVDVEPTRAAEPVAEVDVFHIHEIPLVESADRVKCFAAHKKTRTGQPAYRAFGGFEALLAVGLGPRLDFQANSHHRVHTAPNQAGQVPRRRVDGAVRVADQRSQGAGLRPAPGGVHQRVDAARPQTTSGLATRTNSSSAGTVATPRLTRGAVARGCPGAQESGAGIALQRFLRGSIGGPVVGDDHVQRTIGGHQSATTETDRGCSRTNRPRSPP